MPEWVREEKKKDRKKKRKRKKDFLSPLLCGMGKRK